MSANGPCTVSSVPVTTKICASHNHKPVNPDSPASHKSDSSQLNSTSKKLDPSDIDTQRSLNTDDHTTGEVPSVVIKPTDAPTKNDLATKPIPAASDFKELTHNSSKADSPTAHKDDTTTISESNSTHDDTSIATDKSDKSTRRRRKGKKRIYRCTGFPNCSMTFTRSEHLARHIRKHTGERPFMCDRCFKRFSRLDNLHQHQQTVHMYENFIMTYPGKKMNVRMRSRRAPYALRNRKRAHQVPAIAGGASGAGAGKPVTIDERRRKRRAMIATLSLSHTPASAAGSPHTPTTNFGTSAYTQTMSPPPSVPTNAQRIVRVTQPNGSALPPPRSQNFTAASATSARFRPDSLNKPCPARTGSWYGPAAISGDPKQHFNYYFWINRDSFNCTTVSHVGLHARDISSC